MTSTASRPSQRFSLNFPTLWENTPQSSLSAHLANWIVLETAGLAIGAYIADNIKIAIKSQHTGHFRLATCPSQFTSAAALPAGKWQQPLLFLCFAVSLACTTCAALHTSLSPPPLSLLWHWREQRSGKPCRCHRRTRHLCTHDGTSRLEAQLVDAAGISPVRPLRVRAFNWQSGSFLGRGVIFRTPRAAIY